MLLVGRYLAHLTSLRKKIAIFEESIRDSRNTVDWQKPATWAGPCAKTNTGPYIFQQNETVDKIRHQWILIHYVCTQIREKVPKKTRTKSFQIWLGLYEMQSLRLLSSNHWRAIEKARKKSNFPGASVPLVFCIQKVKSLKQY